MDYSDIYPKEKSILLVGSYPPPIGGVSVHIYRLFHMHNLTRLYNTIKAGVE